MAHTSIIPCAGAAHLLCCHAWFEGDRLYEAHRSPTEVRVYLGQRRYGSVPPQVGTRARSQPFCQLSAQPHSVLRQRMIEGLGVGIARDLLALRRC